MALLVMKGQPAVASSGFRPAPRLARPAAPRAQLRGPSSSCRRGVLCSVGPAPAVGHRAARRGGLGLVCAAEPVAPPTLPAAASSKNSLQRHQADRNQPASPDNLYSPSISCPHGFVEAVMRKQADGIMSTTPDAALLDVIPLLNKVTGLPVIDDRGVVIGVISRVDIIRVRKAGGLMADRVRKHMTAPALTIALRATVQDAANLMMQKGIRRLPVVDADGRPLGLVSRSDIFRPLGDFKKAMAAEVAALQGAGSWQIKYLYDGSCPICSSMKALLERRDGDAGRMIFVDVSSEKYKPSKNMGISVDEAMTTIHAIRPDGSVLQGTEAIRAMYSVVGLGWLSFLMELPFVTQLVDVLYDFISRNRISLGNAMDALVAGKKLQMAKQGTTVCGDLDEECAVDW